MKTIIKCLLMILWLTGTALTQELTSATTEKYSNSIQFAITDRFTLGAFEGSIISYKRHFSEQNAIRIGFGASINLETRSSDIYAPTKDTLDRISDREFNYEKYELSILLLHFSKFNHNLRFYFGVGPTVTKSSGSSKYNYTYYDYNPDTLHYSIRESDYSGNGVGAIGAFGFEWKFNPRIRFIAEYGATYLRGKDKSESEDKSIYSNEPRYDVTETKYTRLTPRYVNFGLSFYF